MSEVTPKVRCSRRARKLKKRRTRRLRLIVKISISTLITFAFALISGGIDSGGGSGRPPDVPAIHRAASI